MDLPKPPQDIELRNIIDKLAQFVARNGPEFEQMTKNKQKGNPKFGFLFGGEHFNYYQYKVTTEQAILKQKSVSNPNVGSGPPLNSLIMGGPGVQSPLALGGGNAAGSPLNLAAAAVTAAQWLAAATQSQSTAPTAITTETLVAQQAVLQEQIRESEQNLNAQHSVLMQQQQSAVEDAITKAQEEKLKADAADCNLNFAELDGILQPIIDSCTKDSISTGKAWILQRATSDKANSVISKYLLSKVLEPRRPFNHKLHIIYLVNDILHHCARKNAEDLKKALETVVVPMFCNASMDVTEEQMAKLNKLLNLWETKNHYCSPETVAKLKQPAQSWAEYQSELIANHSQIFQTVTAATKSTFHSYQSQHQAFVSHALQQIQNLEQQKQTLENQKHAVSAIVPLAAATPPDIGSVPTNLIASGTAQLTNSGQTNDHILQQQQMAQLQQTGMNQIGEQPSQQLMQQQSHETMLPQGSGPVFNPPENQDGNVTHVIPGMIPSQPPPDININFTQPPPGFMPNFPPPGIELPDFSRPPPGFPGIPPPPPPAEIMPDDLLPSLPYYDLPAGLMVPLINLEDTGYKPLDPESIRLPPPAPPSERLLAAVKAFYAPPGHDHPRDSDGWEKLGLYEYYRAKNSAKKRKDEDIAVGLRQKSKSPSPITRPKSRSKTPPPKKRYRSRSRSKSRGRGSRSPGRRNNNVRGNINRRRSGSRRDRSKSRSRSRSRSRSPSVQPNKERSPSPPSFLTSFAKSSSDKLDETNKGHQMLKKMGWGGAGLGVKEQGIEQPISSGEIRDRVDQYKGVGVNLNDPYENFRKSKGQAFITRMKARAEERV